MDIQVNGLALTAEFSFMSCQYYTEIQKYIGKLKTLKGVRE